jgi:exonuclease SbcD
MRILHTADWHLGRTLEGRSRLEEQAAFIDELVAIVRDQEIDVILMAGDVYDSVNPPAAAEQLFFEALSRLSDGGRRHVVVIAGNHDHPDRIASAAPLAHKQRISLLGWPASGLLALDVPRTGERALVYALPYPSESRLRTLLVDETGEEPLRRAYSERVAQIVAQETREFGPGTVNLVMSHLYVLGGKETDSERPIQVGGAYTVDAAALCTGAQYVALGHLHRPQTVPAPIPLRYSGSPLAYSFSEAGQAKSVSVLDLAPGKAAQPEEIFLSSGRPLVRWEARQGLVEVYRWLEEGRDANAWIDLEIHLNESLSMEQIQRLRLLHSGFVHIRPVYPQQEGGEELRSAQANLPIDELFRRFYERQTGGAQPEPELVRLFLELVQDSREEREWGEGA